MLEVKKLPLKRKILVALVFSLIIPFTLKAALAEQDTDAEETQEQEADQEEIDELEDKIKKLEKKIDSLRNQGSTLQNEIDYLDNQMNLTQLRIQSVNNQIVTTTEKIAELGEEIENLNTRLDKIADSIKYQEKLLNQRQREHYKTDQGLPKSFEMILFLLEPLELDKKIQKNTYSKVMQEKDRSLLEEMNKTKIAYANQKGIFENKQEEEEKLKAEVEAQKANLEVYKTQLDGQKAEKENLLASTQNDEAKYQQLLKEAQEQLDSFRGFVSNAGGSIIGSDEFGKGKEGWYFSQRDERWANTSIGKSGEKVFDVGCLITSIAMVYKAEGKDITPKDIAKDTSRFWYNTAWMLRPWEGPGDFTPISKSSIDANLKKRPVIVGVYAGAYGTHFVVLAEKDEDNYIMYDPWYGPDLDFSDYYSFPQIFEAAVFL
jgi:peptidoglycan hydrolase CwlO-like protein